jgi:hypothetical protein
MANIFARSPYLIRIAETTPTPQNGSKVELFLANGSFTGSPQYTLSKLIPASNNVETLYDISPYIREYIRFASCALIQSIGTVTNPTTERVNVRVKRYKLVGLTYTLLDTTDYLAFDGYSYYEDGYNFDNGNIGLDAGTYYYNPTSDAGKIRITNCAVVYRTLSTTILEIITADATTRDIRRVRNPNSTQGNIVEIYDGTTTALLKTFTFLPIEECKYTPVIIDFINKYGAWHREFFFKASTDNFNVENTEYNLMQTDSFNYNVKEGQRKVFNANGKKSVKVNTGWVNESWKEVLKQIMLSERILIDDKPAKINSKSTELFKHINTKQINYSLEFEFAYDVINSVI